MKMGSGATSFQVIKTHQIFTRQAPPRGVLLRETYLNLKEQLWAYSML